jgi:hypothetical protein
MFGSDAKMGLTSSPLPQEILSKFIFIKMTEMG